MIGFFKEAVFAWKYGEVIDAYTEVVYSEMEYVDRLNTEHKLKFFKGKNVFRPINMSIMGRISGEKTFNFNGNLVSIDDTKEDSFKMLGSPHLEYDLERRLRYDMGIMIRDDEQFKHTLLDIVAMHVLTSKGFSDTTKDYIKTRYNLDLKDIRPTHLGAKYD